MLDTPALGIQQSEKEIFKMADDTEEMLSPLRDVMASQKNDSDKEGFVFDNEQKIDIIQKEIMEFLSDMMAGNISHEVMGRGRQQLRMADEYESVSDYITNILKLNLKMRDAEQTMSDEGLRDILELHDSVADYIGMINRALKAHDVGVVVPARNRGNDITRTMKECRTRHLERVGTGAATPLKSLIYTDILNAYRRIKDHGLNIAEVLGGEK